MCLSYYRKLNIPEDQRNFWIKLDLQSLQNNPISIVIGCRDHAGIVKEKRMPCLKTVQDKC